MAKIDPITEAKIKASAKVMDVLTYDLGVELHRSGSEYDGLCPFHADRNLGSFKVSESKNIATCFSCGKTWNSVDLLMEGKGMDYLTALRYLAARYGILVDSEPVPAVSKCEPRPVTPPLPMIYWSGDLVKRYLGNEDKNPLLKYLLDLPLIATDKARLMMAIRDMYLVGTSIAGNTAGWTIWWQIDEQFRVRTGKMMEYLADGHRNKANKYSTTWTHTRLEQAGQWSRKTNRVETCLFGLHLLTIYPNAEICIVESEKSAVICQAFSDPRERLWMATASKSQLTAQRLKPLIDHNRYIVLYPDYDGYDEWVAAADRIGYKRLSVSNKIRTLHTPADGDKADIADIMLRLVHGIEETEAERACRRLGRPDKLPEMGYLIDRMKLTLQD